MPNYAYKCCECEKVDLINLPISTDPKYLFLCDCGHNMHRIIISGAQFPEKVGRVYAGDWFKKTYGHDIDEVAKGRAQEKMEYDAEKLKLESDGVRITHRSRQVGGKDRIRVPDKDDD